MNKVKVVQKLQDKIRKHKVRIKELRSMIKILNTVKA